MSSAVTTQLTALMQAQKGQGRALLLSSSGLLCDTAKCGPFAAALDGQNVVPEHKKMSHVLKLECSIARRCLTVAFVHGAYIWPWLQLR